MTRARSGRPGRSVVAAVLGVAVLGLVTVLPAVPASADARRDSQWHVSALRLAEAHTISRGAGVVVAVLDSGVDATHPDLVGNVLPGTDLVGGGTGDGRGDRDGHGTGMAGLIAAHGHGPGGRDGALGIAPEAKILPIRVDTGSGAAVPGSRYAGGIRWAISHGARIISISADTSGDDFAAVQEAHAAGIIVVGSAGNTDKNPFVGTPARYDGYALAVGGTDRAGKHAAISVTGASLDIAAPAVEIVSTSKNGGYRTGTGTSDAAAIVSGALALIWSRYPALTRDEVVLRLLRTAADTGTPGKDEQTGNGLIDIVAALTAEVGPLPSAAPPSIAPTAVPTDATGATAMPGTAESGPARLPLVLGGAVVLLAGLTLIIVTARRRGRNP